MSLLVTETTTSLLGSAPSATVNVSVVAASVTIVEPLDSTTTTPQTSSSATLTTMTLSATSA